jgi:hypothetical protein
MAAFVDQLTRQFAPIPLSPPVMTAVLPAKSFADTVSGRSWESGAKAAISGPITAIGGLMGSECPVGCDDTGARELVQSHLRKSLLERRSPISSILFLFFSRLTMLGKELLTLVHRLADRDRFIVFSQLWEEVAP